jgi:hypothetical protein
MADGDTGTPMETDGPLPTDASDQRAKREESPEAKLCPVCEVEYNEDTPYMLRCEV